MEQARDAALRGNKRRKWRMGCAERELDVWDAEYGAGLQVVDREGREADM